MPVPVFPSPLSSSSTATNSTSPLTSSAQQQINNNSIRPATMVNQQQTNSQQTSQPSVPVDPQLIHQISSLLEVIITSADNSARTQAEEQLKQLEVSIPVYPMALYSLIISPPAAPNPTANLLPQQQLAAILLKQYAERHWDHSDSKFQPPEAAPEVKQFLRVNLLGHMDSSPLRHPVGKIRNAIAHAISKMAYWDFPEQWPGLVDQLLGFLHCTNSNQQLQQRDLIQGALAVFLEFANELTDEQIKSTYPRLFPALLSVYTNQMDGTGGSEGFSAGTRAMAVSILTSCLHPLLLLTSAGADDAFTEAFLIQGGALGQWVPSMVAVLNSTDPQHQRPIFSHLQAQTLKCLTCMVRLFPKVCREQMVVGNVMQPVWQLLVQTVPRYVQCAVKGLDDIDGETDNDDGDDKNEIDPRISGDFSGLDQLVFSLFEFVTSLVDGAGFKSMVKPSLPELLYQVVSFLQITEEQDELWTSNPAQYINDEEDETLSYNVRIAGDDLLTTLGETYKSNASEALLKSVVRHLEEQKQQKLAKLSNAPAGQLSEEDQEVLVGAIIEEWKVKEACFMAVGKCFGFVESSLRKGRCSGFSPMNFLETFAFPVLSLADGLASPASVEMNREAALASNSSIFKYIVGRSLWLCGIYSSFLPADVTAKCVAFCVANMGEEKPAVVRINALKALHGFLGNADNADLLSPHLEGVICGLSSMVKITSPELILLVLEALISAVKVNPSVTIALESKISPLLLAIWLKYPEDHLLGSAIIEVVEAIGEQDFAAFNGAPNGQFFMPMFSKRAVPTIVSILKASPTFEGNNDGAKVDGNTRNTVPASMAQFAMELLALVIKYTPSPGAARLGTGTGSAVDASAFTHLLNNVFPVLCQTVHTSDDSSTLQSATDCLKYLIDNGAVELAQWSDGTNNGLYYVVNAIARLLSPVQTESSALYVGRLIRKLILKVPEVLQNCIQDMLLAVLERIHESHALTFLQEMVLVFAQLIHADVNWVVEYLLGVTVHEEVNGLKLLMEKWVDNQETFHGVYDIKVSITALSNIYAHLLGLVGQAAANPSDATLAQKAVFLNGMTVPKRVVVEHKGKGKSSSDVILTRSQARRQGAKVEKIIEVPLKFRIFELLTKEFAQCSAEEEEYRHREGGEDDDDGDGDYEEEEEGPGSEAAADARQAEYLYEMGALNDEQMAAAQMRAVSQSKGKGKNAFKGPDDYAMLSDMLGFDGGCSDEEEEDEDAKLDPLNDINLAKYLREVLMQIRGGEDAGTLEMFVGQMDKDCQHALLHTLPAFSS
eukprot:Nk52_evm35s228 gene=Nk52_evmTU35s228